MRRNRAKQKPAYIPSLLLNFAVEKALHSQVTFTRASAAYYENAAGIWQSAAINEPRFHHASGISLGLLVEETRTNNLLFGCDLTNAAWVKVGCTALMDAVGIEGTANSGSTLTATAPAATCLQTLALAAAARSSSFFLKRKTGSGTVSICRNGVAFTDITAQINSDTFTRVKIENSSVLNPVIGIKLDTTGDEIIVCFAQDEAGNSTTSPIKTEGVAVARSADVASITGADFSSWFNAVEGTFVVSWNDPLNSKGRYLFAAITDATNRIAANINASNILDGEVIAAGSDSLVSSTPTISISRNTLALAYKANNGAVSVNGAGAAQDSTVTLPASPTSLSIGARPGISTLNGTISKFVYYSSRLTNANLLTLSEQ